MTTLSKTLLTIAIVGLIVGSVVACYRDNASPLALTAVLPLGAISLGLFLISLVLEKEVAVYDLEQARKLPGSPCNAASAPAKRDSPTESPSKDVQLKENAV